MCKECGCECGCGCVDVARIEAAKELTLMLGGYLPQTGAKRNAETVGETFKIIYAAVKEATELAAQPTEFAKLLKELEAYRAETDSAEQAKE